MKTPYIVGIVLVAVLISIIISTYGDASTYVSFSEASERPGREFHVVGTLARDSAMTYDPLQDANYFSFYLTDDDSVTKKVVFLQPMPPDFERSEKIVIIGKMEENTFHASSILLKCPSKYNDGTIETKEYKAE